jgi:ribonuclease P protein component
MLAKNFRLTKRGSFTYVYNRGERKSDKLLSLIFLPSKSLKIGFSVPNKTGNAVKRNLIKRRLRAIVRNLLPRLRPAQAVIAARSGADGLTYGQLNKAAEELFERAKLIKNFSGQ